MSKVCEKHREHPVKIYDQCVGCEIESLRAERDKLIKGITYFMREFGKIPVSSATAGAGHAYRRMHDILKEIGVMDI
jgi:hypothetical protein